MPRHLTTPESITFSQFVRAKASADNFYCAKDQACWRMKHPRRAIFVSAQASWQISQMMSWPVLSVRLHFWFSWRAKASPLLLVALVCRPIWRQPRPEVRQRERAWQVASELSYQDLVVQEKSELAEKLAELSQLSASWLEMEPVVGLAATRVTMAAELERSGQGCGSRRLYTDRTLSRSS